MLPNTGIGADDFTNLPIQTTGEDQEVIDLVRKTTPEEEQQAKTLRWALDDAETRLRYGGLIAAFTLGQVWGTGRNYTEALENAKQKGCPPQTEMMLFPVPYYSASESEEFGWLLRDATLRKQYNGLVLAFHDRKVLGAGLDREGALQAGRVKGLGLPEDQVRFIVLW